MTHMTEQGCAITSAKRRSCDRSCALVEKLKEKDGVSVYNLGTGNRTIRIRYGKAFGKACGKEIPHVIKPRRAGDIATCYCDASKAKRNFTV